MEVFHLSGQVKGLLLSWCAGVCDGTGKIEIRGEFNDARARRALVDWYLSLFVMCKA